MKYRYLYIVLVSFVTTLMSCDSLLNETPYNKVTVGNFYSTQDGIANGVNGLYSTLRGLYIQEYLVYMCEGPSDLWKGSYCPESFKYWTIDATDASVKNMWNHCYKSINQCNAVLDALTEYTIPGLSETLKDRYIGEAKFIRAHYLYHLVQQFGDVPMSLHATTSVETTVHKTKSEDVWKQVIDDLKFAVDNLPAQYNNAEYGRITKYAALHHLARVLLTVNRGEEDLRDALSYAEEVMKGSHKLVDTHKYLWNINNKRNSEVLFPVLYTTNEELNGEGNGAFRFFTSDYSSQCAGVKRVPEYGHPWTRIQSTQYALDLFDEAKDLRFKDCFQSEWRITEPEFKEQLFNPQTRQMAEKVWKKGDLVMITTKNRWTKEQILDMWPINVYLPEYMRDEIDPAKDIQSMSNPNAPWPSNTKFMFYNFYTYLVKHQDPTRPASTYSKGQRDVFVFRLADTYLMAGELCLLLNDKNKAAGYINVVRRRAAVLGKEADMEIKASDVNIDFILDERARELTGEMFRWYDLKRTGKLSERLNNPQMNPTLAGKFKDYHVLRPIPRDQMVSVTNPEEFVQNPGYGN